MRRLFAVEAAAVGGGLVGDLRGGVAELAAVLRAVAAVAAEALAVGGAAAVGAAVDAVVADLASERLDLTVPQYGAGLQSKPQPPLA